MSIVWQRLNEILCVFVLWILKYVFSVCEFFIH